MTEDSYVGEYFKENNGFVLSNNGHIILFTAVNKYGTVTAILSAGSPPLCLRLQVSISRRDGTMSLCLINFLLGGNSLTNACQLQITIFIQRELNRRLQILPLFVIHWVSVRQLSFVQALLLMASQLFLLLLHRAER